ncbi:hypothetical protein [Motilibacter aurantiacus]|uniref:hypothetical protein n=1 Tax=Motilibacter aurantiacus TaxID=2714955 RepID=UPI001E2CB6EA|nr:hypothetical protein [Motilibacter aurantiacus]
MTGLACAGCAGARAEAAETAATQFARALQEQDGAAACAVLAPSTADELEQDAGQECPAAVTDAELNEAGAAVGVDVFDGQARVRLEHDTYFLSRFDDGWRVAAAGCTERPGLPYDCTVKGG